MKLLQLGIAKRNDGGCQNFQFNFIKNSDNFEHKK